MKKSIKRDLSVSWASQFILNFVLLILVIIWMLPAFGLFISSFRPSGEIATSGWWNFFKNPVFTLKNYQIVLISSNLIKSFFNSLLIAVPSTILTVLVAALAAYPIASFKFPGRLLLFVTFLTSQIIPLQVTLIPVLKMLNFIGLAGTFPGVWLAHTAYGLPLAIYLFRNFFAGIPYTLIESAEIDGASKFSLLYKIILPLSLPAVASVAIFQFIWVWSDLLVSLVYLGGAPEVAPLTVKIASLMGSLESGWHIMTTAAFISMILPLLVFISMQKYFIKGVLAGAVKG